MPWQLHENAYISMACFNAPCDKRQGHRPLIYASPRAISNLLQLLPRAIPGTSRLKLIILYGQKPTGIMCVSFDDIVKVTKSVRMRTYKYSEQNYHNEVGGLRCHPLLISPAQLPPGSARLLPGMPLNRAQPAIPKQACILPLKLNRQNFLKNQLPPGDRPGLMPGRSLALPGLTQVMGVKPAI